MSDDKILQHFTDSRILSKNVIFNMFGQIIPTILALIAIPILIKGLGTERFGILSLAWAVIGYFGLFDLGLSRALTQILADKLGKRQDSDIPAIFWTTMTIMLFLSIIAIIILFIVTPWLVQSMLKIPKSLMKETIYTLYIISFSIPIIIITAGLIGLLSAYQRFDLINKIKVPTATLSVLGPILIVQFFNGLVPVVALLLLLRLLSLIVHIIVCLHVVPMLRLNITISKNIVTPILSIGSWMTVSNIIGPLMVYMDRFLIGSLLSVAAVAYYTTPYEFVTKLWIISGAIVGVLFPAFATSYKYDSDRTQVLYLRGIKYILLTLFPLCLCIITFAHEGLDLWLGSGFANNGAVVLQWLTIGVFINSAAHVPFALLQSVGRPDLTAKLHLVELPIYIFFLWWMTNSLGIVGVAIAWVIRLAIDTIALLIMSTFFLPRNIYKMRWLMATFIGAIFILFLSTMFDSRNVKFIFLIIMFCFYCLYAWFFMLPPSERFFFRNFIKCHS